MTTSDPQCRCNGTGAYTVEVSVADAVVIVRRVCLKHVAPRTRLRDTATNRVGELMDFSKASGRVYLRPEGGGREWSTDAGSVEPVGESA